MRLILERFRQCVCELFQIEIPSLELLHVREGEYDI